MIKRKPGKGVKHNVPSDIEFDLHDIYTAQFALRPNLPVQGEEALVSFQIRFGIQTEGREIACGFYYSIGDPGHPAIVLDVVCEFKFSSSSWNKIQKNGSLILSKELAREMGMITSGVARGILHARTENTTYNNFPVMLIKAETLIPDQVRLR